MINLLEPFSNFCLSKMMLDIYPHMIRQGTDMISRFLDSGMYQPELMQEAILVTWPTDLETFVFTSHTNLITQKMLVDELKDPDAVIEQKEETTFMQSIKEIKLEKERRLRAKNLRPQNLVVEEQEESNIKRVKVEALDMDWVFKGDNCKNMLTLLNQQDKSKLFVQQ